jgi:ADP-heptose:LPS heptosyltransferase
VPASPGDGAEAHSPRSGEPASRRTPERDFADSPAIITNPDLAISIDTWVAHLAGARGKPCWTLLSYGHLDWRYLRYRTDSPWYPSLKLYRKT